MSTKSMPGLKLLSLTEIDMVLHFGPGPLMDEGYQEHRFEVVALAQLAADQQVVDALEGEIVRLNQMLKNIIAIRDAVIAEINGKIDQLQDKLDQAEIGLLNASLERKEKDAQIMTLRTQYAAEFDRLANLVEKKRGEADEKDEQIAALTIDYQARAEVIAENCRVGTQNAGLLIQCRNLKAQLSRQGKQPETGRKA